MKVGELLVRAGIISDAQLGAALAEQERWGGRLGRTLVRMGFVTEDVLTRALSRQLGIPRIEPERMVPRPEALARVTAAVAERHGVLPLELRDEGATLVVALSEPHNLTALDELKSASGCRRVAAWLAGETSILEGIRRHYHAEEAAPARARPFVDTQGRQVPPPPHRDDPAPGPGTPPEPPDLRQLSELVDRLEENQAAEVRALRALVDALIARGVFSREEYAARLGAPRGAPTEAP